MFINIILQLHSMLKQKNIWRNIYLFYCLIFIFVIDTFSFYWFHYYILYLMAYFLLLQLFYIPSNKHWITFAFFIFEWTFTTHAPYIPLCLYIFYKKLSFISRKYLYTSPSIPLVLCIFGWITSTISLRIHQGHWPFPSTFSAAICSFFINIIGIIILNMIYCYSSKQGNR